MGFTRTVRAVGSAALTGALVFAAAPHAAADDVRDKQWPLSAFDADSIWKISKGKGETVAVIDDGVNAEHPDLKGNVLKGKDFVDGGSAEPNPGDYHGTAMAGLIAGHGHGPGNSSGIMGLAPEAKILPIREDDKRQDGMADSIHYAVDHGASIINISMAGGKANGSAEADAIAYALKHGVLVVAGTGNDGLPVGYPAAHPGAVAVGGVKSDGTLWSKSNSGRQTLLSGPAADVLSTAGPSNLNGYGMGDGTSNATAYASAAAALLHSKYPDLTPGQIANRLTKSAGLPASKKNLKLPDEHYGYGFIQPLAALKRNIPNSSKYGPLSVPQSLKDGALREDKTQSPSEAAAMQKAADQKAVLLWCITGVVFLGAVALVTVLIVRRKKRNVPGGPGAPGGWSHPEQGASPGYGWPPHQQQSAPQQPTASGQPPQQPPSH